MRKGLSLLEILISVGLASTVFLIVSSMLITFYNSDSRSKRLEVFEKSKNDLILLLSNSVRWAEVVLISENDLIVDGHTFALRSDGRLYKDDDVLTPEGLRITKFEIQDYSGIPGYPSILVDISMEDKDNVLRMDTLKLIVSVRKATSIISP
ncbi:MAG: hypothetical protein AAB909_02580 [Patescibacteria group bacterium]